jgi:phosphatidylethanolamine-binding protein (PEBP) family uncharacterized protein
VTRVLEKVEAGGVETGNTDTGVVPEVENNPNYLSERNNNRIPRPYFDTYRVPTNKPWIINNTSNLPMNPKIPFPQPQLLAQTGTKTRDGKAEEVALELPLKRELVSLVEWDCNEETHASLLLRSPLFDSCENGAQIPALLPSEFQCDTTNTVEIIRRRNGTALPHTTASPPLAWHLASPVTGLSSYSIVLENSETNRVYWFVTGIPANVNELTLGASFTDSTLPKGAVEHINSFGVAGYTSPCPDHTNTTTPFRFHLFALRDTPTPSTTDLKSLVSNFDTTSLLHATLDVFVPLSNVN